jgi:hypothetical protein
LTIKHFYYINTIEKPFFKTKRRGKMKTKTLSLVTTAVLICCFCSDKPKTRDFNSSEEFMDNPSVQDGIDESGQPVNQGDDPPPIAGKYYAVGSVVDSTHSSLVGSPIDSSICLYDQTHSGLINYAEVAGDTAITATGNYVTGDFDRFTIWQEADAYFYGCRQHNALIMSGYKLENGDLQVSGLTVVLEAEDCDSLGPGFWFQTEFYMTLECACSGLGDLYSPCSSDICSPGETQSCVCSDGSPGTQSCLSDGSGWGNCGSCLHEWWTDPSTGLMWQDPYDNGYFSCSSDAPAYCAHLTLGGYSDWRMPDINELRTLVQGCTKSESGGSCPVTISCADPSCWSTECSGCPANLGPGQAGTYWDIGLTNQAHLEISSSTRAGAGIMGNWTIDFTTGEIFNNESTSCLIRCVR